MPLFGSIIWAAIHMLVALGLNMLAVWIGWIHHGELFTIYWIVMAIRLYDAQMKFSVAYKENPELVEDILRHQLLDK